MRTREASENMHRNSIGHTRVHPDAANASVRAMLVDKQSTTIVVGCCAAY